MVPQIEERMNQKKDVVDLVNSEMIKFTPLWNVKLSDTVSFSVSKDIVEIKILPLGGIITFKIVEIKEESYYLTYLYNESNMKMDIEKSQFNLYSATYIIKNDEPIKTIEVLNNKKEIVLFTCTH